MIQRVYEQCEKAQTLEMVIVATDDQRIYNHVLEFGGNAAMTKTNHQSGTERMTEIAANYSEFTHYMNIQGDEPFINPLQIDLLGKLMESQPDIDICTLKKELKDPKQIHNPNVVKVVTNFWGDAMYFSRSPIPYPRNASKVTYYKHIGIYGFKREVLLKVPEMKTDMSEEAESLEQLRWLANGYKIRTLSTELESISVDTPEDLEGIL